MASWQTFADEAPILSKRGLERLESTGLCLVGTLRKDGPPRVSPVEPLVVGSELYLGMMWQSMKARDLERDPRCVVHSTTNEKDGRQGDFKLYGRGVPIGDPAELAAYCEALRSLTGWAPEGERWHLFSLDIEKVGWFQAIPPDGHDIEVWYPGAAPQTRSLPT